jgi:indole-3-glycerol phosphate synthase
LGILEEIVATAHRRVKEKKGELPLAQIETRVERSDRSFKSALKGKGTGIVAEIKRASPSRGIIHPDLNVEKWAQAYQKGGACAISVLTEPAFFRGSLSDLRKVREASHLPVLLKDFVIDPYQVYEARLWGADSILLITSVLGADELLSLLELSEALGMTPLVEVHTEKEIERAIKSGAEIVGVNNRNLADFTVSLNTTFRLLPFIPKGKLTVSESGIDLRSQVVELEKAGVNACLVGEALMRSEDPGSKLQELLGAEG